MRPNKPRHSRTLALRKNVRLDLTRPFRVVQKNANAAFFHALKWIPGPILDVEQLRNLDGVTRPCLSCCSSFYIGVDSFTKHFYFYLSHVSPCPNRLICRNLSLVPDLLFSSRMSGERTYSVLWYRHSFIRL